jgi:hypothetical protein
MSDQPTLFDEPEVFDGETFDASLDGKRLTTQLHRVRKLMSDREWRTLAEIHRVVGGSDKIRAMLMGCAPSLRAWEVTRRLTDLREVGYTAPEIRKRMEVVQRWYQFEDIVSSMIEEVK